MQKLNLSRKRFEVDDVSSDASEESVLYISSGEEDLSNEWESDCSTDTEEMVARNEKEVSSSR